jgi:hypothetical protein
LWQAGKQGRRGAVISSAKLTSVARFEVGSYVSIHTWPVVTLKKALFGFVDAIVPNKFIAMGIYKGLLLEAGREKNDDSAWFELTFNATPNNVIFDKAVVCKNFNKLLAFCVERQFFVEEEIFESFNKGITILRVLKICGLP